MGRTSTLDKHDGLRQFIAERYMEGMKNQAIAESVHEAFPDIETPTVRSIQNWRNDPEVANKIQAVTRERIARVVRRTDSAIENLNFEELTVDEILKIRKEYVPHRDAFTDEKTDSTKVAEDLFGVMEEDPEFAEKISQAANDAE